VQWDPANFIWMPRLDIFANGDGSFVMPGPDGPVSSIRYETIRDGLEDIELLKLAAAVDPSSVAALAAAVVRGPTTYETDPVVIMETRAKVAAILRQGAVHGA